MSDIFEGAIVEKKNAVNELITDKKDRFTLQELRFFSLYLAKINPYDQSTRRIKIKLSDFQKIMGFKTLNRAQLDKATDCLLKKIVRIPLESGGNSKFQLFREFTIDKDSGGEWCIFADAHDNALPLLFDFKDRYFKYELWNILYLNSTYQFRMYEILKQYETIGKREIEVSKLKDLLGIELGKYERWERFKTQILNGCQRALKETTDICYTYERGKTGAGGKWLTIVFYIYHNNNYSRQMIFDEFINDDIKALIQTEGGESSEPQQLELCDTQTDESTAFFSSACNDEFTAAQIESIIAVINTMELPAHDMGALFAKYHYLLEQYTRFKAIAERSTINNRYSYFYTMIQSERDKQRAGDTK